MMIEFLELRERVKPSGIADIVGSEKDNITSINRISNNYTDRDVNERIETLIHSHGLDLTEWLDVLSKILLKLRAEVNSQTLQDIKRTLGLMHRSHILWKVNNDNHSHLWKRFLQLYLSLPDRLASIFEIKDDDIFVPRNFLICMGKGLVEHATSIVPQRVADVLGKSNSIGGISTFVELLIQDDTFDSLLSACLSLLSSRPKEVLQTEIFHQLDLLYHDSPLELYRRVRRIVNQNWNIETRQLSSIPFAVLACILRDIPLCNPFPHELVAKVVNIWGIKNNILLYPLHEQVQFTRLLLVCLSYVSQDSLQGPRSLEFMLLDGIQRRLDSSDKDLSLLGKVVAECFATILPVETQLIFGIDDKKVTELRETFFFGRKLNDLILIKQGYPFVTGIDTSFMVHDVSSRDVDDFQDTEPVINGIPVDSFKPNEISIAKATEMDEEARNAKIKKPKYLRECLAYLKCNDDPFKLELALTELPSLLVSSSMILREEVGIDLFRYILFLGEDFSIPQFDQNRRGIMSRLLADLPEQLGSFVVKEICGKSASLGQKVEAIISCMVAIKAVISEKYEISEDKRELSESNIRMKLFDQQLGFNTEIAVKSVPTLRNLILYIVTPLLKTVKSSNSSIFSMTNNILLEKIIYLAGYALFHSSNLPEFYPLLRCFLTVIHPLLTEANPMPRGILTALITSIQSALSSWSVHSDIFEYLEILADIDRFFESNEQILILDQDHIVMAALAQSRLKELTDPIKLLEAVVIKEQLAFSVSEIKLRNQ